MTNSVSDRHRTSLRDSQQRKTIQFGGCYYCLEVFDPGVERKIGHVPIRQAISALVVTDESMIARELRQQVTPDRTAPIEFQMAEPVRRPSPTAVLRLPWRRRYARHHRWCKNGFAVPCSQRRAFYLR